MPNTKKDGKFHDPRRDRTPEELEAELLAEHGPEAVAAFRKLLATEPPKPGVKPHQRDRVGAKPLKPPKAVPRPKGGVSLRERNAMAKATGETMDPPRLVRLYRTAKAGRPCRGCGVVVGAGVDAGLISDSVRSFIVHDRCVPTALAELTAERTARLERSRREHPPG